MCRPSSAPQYPTACAVYLTQSRRNALATSPESCRFFSRSLRGSMVVLNQLLESSRRNVLALFRWAQQILAASHGLIAWLRLVHRRCSGLGEVTTPEQLTCILRNRNQVAVLRPFWPTGGGCEQQISVGYREPTWRLDGSPKHVVEAYILVLATSTSHLTRSEICWVGESF